VTFYTCGASSFTMNPVWGIWGPRHKSVKPPCV
jgi:hypothetical protein